jgi:chromosome segregation ATPase
MNEEPTKDLPGKKSFEERVFARFDAMDARFDTVDTRLEKLEARSYDTKPIWEKALTAIVETGKEVGEIKNRVVVIETAIAGLATDVGVLKADVGVLKTDVRVLKTDVAGLNTNYGGIKNEFVDIRRELRENVRHELSLILKFLIEDRQDIRDAEDRIRQIETKLV